MTIIGYLIPLPNTGWAVNCPQCNHVQDRPTWMYDGTHIRVFHENVFPYSQHCFTCKRRLVLGKPGWPDLFDGKPRFSHPTQ